MRLKKFYNIGHCTFPQRLGLDGTSLRMNNTLAYFVPNNISFITSKPEPGQPSAELLFSRGRKLPPAWQRRRDFFPPKIPPFFWREKTRPKFRQRAGSACRRRQSLGRCWRSWSQCYKNYLLLRHCHAGQISYSVCSWQKFQALSTLCEDRV